jgi:hypothetical protein
MATQMGAAFDPLVELFVPALIRVTSRANKVFVTRAQKALLSIVDGVASPRLLARFLDGMSNANKNLRAGCITCMLRILRQFNETAASDASGDIEAALRLGLVDADASVRDTSRQMYHLYRTLCPDQAEAYVKQL